MLDDPGDEMNPEGVYGSSTLTGIISSVGYMTPILGFIWSPREAHPQLQNWASGHFGVQG